METDVTTRPTPQGDAMRAEWRPLTHLRDRVETAANEIERLRTENVALAQRVLELQNGRAEMESAHTFGEGEDSEALRAKIEGFIKSIDEILETPATDENRGGVSNE